MTVRKWLAAAAVAAGTTFTGIAFAAEPVKPIYGFATLKSMPAETAKAKLTDWLNLTGKMDQAKFDAIWAQEGRSVHDRTIESIVLAMPEAGILLSEARKPEILAPVLLPDLVRDPKMDPFVQSNLAAAYARSLGTKRVYEESLEAAKTIKPELVVDPAGYYFFKAVAEHALILREAAVSSIARLLDDVTDAPDRYRVIATMMFFDIQNWAKDEKDLTNITRLMDNSGRRLDLARGGPKTQEIQKKIVFNLDEKIKQLEEEEKKKKPGPGGGPPGPPMPGNGSGPPNGPMQDSFGGTNGGKGIIDEKKLRNYEKNWGTLPETERKKIVQDITRDLPAKYKPMIEDYFRSLNRMNGYKDKP